MLDYTDKQLNRKFKEFKVILNWASSHKMVTNISKTKGIVCRRFNPRMDVDCLNLPHVDRITEAKFVGVEFFNKLNFNAHINFF